MAYAFCIDFKYPGCPWEEIDSFDTRSEALKKLKNCAGLQDAGHYWECLKR